MAAFRRGKQGFSLVEVTLALGIFVFAGFALVGLLGTVMRGSHDTREQTQAATIMESICSTRRATPLANLSARNFPLPPLNPSGGTANDFTNPIGLTWDGAQTTVTDPSARFGMIYSVVDTPGYTPMVSPGEANVYICIYWPAAASPTSGATGRFEVNTSFLLP
jgi:Tfp pilus assembly protein PilV